MSKETKAAPEPGQKWRARDVVDIYSRLLGFEFPPSVIRVLSCLIGHANPETGQLNPRQRTVAKETGYCRQTVNESIKLASEEGFLAAERKDPQQASHYKVNWGFTDFLHMCARALIEPTTLRESSVLGIAPLSSLTRQPPLSSQRRQHLSPLRRQPLSPRTRQPLSSLTRQQKLKENLKREPKTETHTPSDDGL
jgi:DNA-binding transcriptional MocR family regulator